VATLEKKLNKKLDVTTSHSSVLILATCTQLQDVLYLYLFVLVVLYPLYKTANSVTDDWII